MSKPVFVLLHGAGHTPRCWDRLVEELAKAGYESVAPALPSSGSTPPTPGWSTDVEVILNTVTNLVGKEHDIVVVMHSFSGLTGGTALDGLDKESRASKNLGGGVVRLIYVVAFLVPKGFQHSPHVQVGIVTVRPEDAKSMFYQELDDGIIAELVKDLQPQSFGAFWSKTTHAAWRHIPTIYIICEADRPTTVAAAQYLVDSAKAPGVSHKIDNLIKVDAGHSPFISKSWWTASILIEEANKSV
ncbi:alpha/beta-hydrolase [Lentithecium fluviatile CBS 122367]|uniref:Alpha/beta-hydrolase n=1 Tax=Lentithecium fluviatile CBS 122367 TaxID=1168545 RepID=A0A6G1JIQ5_9PLEO|nr:alpha/beta-hydrolase [Lentithecium fluviatile CBS 122367]